MFQASYARATGGHVRAEQNDKKTDRKEEVKQAERNRNFNEEVEDEYSYFGKP